MCTSPLSIKYQKYCNAYTQSKVFSNKNGNITETISKQYYLSWWMNLDSLKQLLRDFGSCENFISKELREGLMHQFIKNSHLHSCS